MIVQAQELRIDIPGKPPAVINGPLVNIDSLADVISAILACIYPLATILLFLYMLWGGYNFLLSRGDPEKVQAGKSRITYALVGFLLLIFSLFIVRLISFVFRLGGGLF